MSGHVDNDAGVISLTFSEPVQATGTTGGTVTVDGSGGGSATNAATGAISAGSTQNLPIDFSDTSGPTGTLYAPGGIPSLVSVATGAAVLPVTGLAVTISY